MVSQMVSVSEIFVSGTDAQESALLHILDLVDQMPLPEPDAPRRGRVETYPLCLFLKATLIMIAKRVNKVHELLQTLAEPTREMQRLRNALTCAGKMPSRRTFERRLARLTLLLPDLIARLGACLVNILQPFAQSGRAAALDSTVLRAKDGAVWHKKHQLTREIPHSRIDTEAGWTKSGWHHPRAVGTWIYDWKLHLACTVGSLWIPLAACLTPADVFDGEIGPTLVAYLPADIRFVRGQPAR